MAGTELYQQLTILLVVATASHFTIKRFRQPTIIGEIAIGILLGPSVLGTFGIQLFDPAIVDIFAALGAIFLLFLIGLESDFRAIYTKKNFLVAVGGVFLPFLAGFFVALLMLPEDASVVGAAGTPFTVATFVGASLVATSTAIAASVLLELGLMRENVAQTIMGAAIVDDILGLLVLSIVVGMSEGRFSPLDLGILMGTAVLFIVVGILLGVYFFSRIVVRIQVAGLRLGLRHGGFIVAMAIAFLYAFVGEVIGLSAIVGAFLAGTMFASTSIRDDFTEGAGYLGAVFTPIFFISLGLQVNVHSMEGGGTLLAFAAVLTALAIVTKVVGCAIPARYSKMTRNEALAVGWGMTPRGEVGLIVAVTALTAQVISNGLFSVIVLVMIVVSVVPAPLFRRSLLAVAEEREAAKRASGEPSQAP